MKFAGRLTLPRGTLFTEQNKGEEVEDKEWKSKGSEANSASTDHG